MAAADRSLLPTRSPERSVATAGRDLAGRDRAADPDGLFRINNVFCHAYSLKSLLSRLVEDGDLVLIDLRSFAPGNDGCIHELHHLIDRVPLHRCLLVVDGTTEKAVLAATLDAAWRDLPADSPSRRQQSPGGPERLCLEPGRHAIRALVVRLCEIAAAPE